jgi:F420-dependent oxidoreductase-like protein
MRSTFRWGLTLASVTNLAEVPEHLFGRIRDVVVAAEAGGWDSVYVPDHVWQNRIGGGPRTPMLEAYTLLGALAAVTSRVHLGAFVSPVTLRSPALLAKIVTSLDVISGGRAILGLGAGTDATEHAAYGIGFPAIAVRQAELDEALAICRLMLSQDQPSFAGSFFRIDEALNVPRPLQPRIPILVGGGGERGTLPAVARHADACNLPPAAEGDLRRKLEVLRRHCEAAARDPAEIAKTAFVLPPSGEQELVSRVGRLLELGMTGVVVAVNAPDVAAVRSWGHALRAAFPEPVPARAQHGGAL